MPKAGQRKDDGIVAVLLTEDCDEKEVRALCHRLGGELGNVVMEWLKQPTAMRKTDRTDYQVFAERFGGERLPMGRR